MYRHHFGSYINNSVSGELVKAYMPDTCDPLLISEEETKTLKTTYQYYTNQLNSDDPITIKLILEMHKNWLGDIYPFTGKFKMLMEW